MYKVLIADDEAIIREGIKCLLDWEGAGFTITAEAANGEEAYQKILSENPDAALLDIRMPKMMGIDVIRYAREHGYTGKIIILSGYSDFKYAQAAIRYGVCDYLTKPIDEDALLAILTSIKEQLDQNREDTDTALHYRQKAHHTIIQDILTGTADLSRLNLSDLHLDADIYQVVIYEKYSHNATDASYRFSDLLRVTNQDNHSYDSITIQSNEVLLLKGSFAIGKFNEFLERYQRENRPQKDSPLDSLFITYGRCVSSLAEVPESYQEAYRLLCRRFFCEQEQHTIGYTMLPELESHTCLIDDAFLDGYASRLIDALCTFNRNLTAETLQELQTQLYQTADPIDSVKFFFTDLYLQIKEHMNRVYGNSRIPLPGNAESIRLIEEKYYLYEIILFLTEQFEIIMSSIGNSSRESVLDDILHYINHNYAGNITLENIAPLFGYNSSYLGKIFSKKMGENFNSYVDHVRIDHSKELLLHDDLKVYEIAEKVGYRNVDYFHIKFKKYVGQTPAEFRKKNR